MKIPRVLFLILFGIVSVAQGADPDVLSFHQAYVEYGRGLMTPLPRVIKWIDARNYLEFKGTKILSVDARSGKSRVFLNPMAHPRLVQEKVRIQAVADTTADQRTICLVRNNRLVVYAMESKEWRVLDTGEGGVENPKFSPDGKSVAFTRSGDLFVTCLDSGKTRRLTTDGSDVILNGYASWVYYEEILGRRSRYRAFWWGPESGRIAYLRFDQSKVPVFPITRSEGIYPELEKQRYPKPGAANPTARLGVVDLRSGTTEWMVVPDDVDHYVAFPRWSPDGKSMYYQWMNRGQDHLRVYRWSGPGTEARQVYEEKQDSWVEFFGPRDMVILRDGSLVIRTSTSGWHHIYHVGPAGHVRPLTTGEWTVKSIAHVDSSGRNLLITASRETSTMTRVYRLSLRKGKLQLLTPEPGSHSITPSPDGRMFLDSYSAVNQPARMVLRSAAGRILRTLGDARTPEVARLKLDRGELIRIPTADGTMLPALRILPPDFDPQKKYPVVLAVYGGPGAASVADRFPGARGLSSFYLSQLGVIVVAVDHRGAGHHGKKGMALMHRRLGYWELHDLIEAVRFFRKQPYVDGKRIGITGGSYGGYVTALALVKAPEYFSCGIASFSVMDWKLYDSVYTERYMDTPEENPEGYRLGSVLEYIDTYKGGLRVVHGSMDDNVHMQNSLQFLDKVQDAGKSVEFMLFPGERHGFRGPKRFAEARYGLDFWSRRFFNHPWTE